MQQSTFFYNNNQHIIYNQHYEHIQQSTYKLDTFLKLKIGMYFYDFIFLFLYIQNFYFFYNDNIIFK